jgi:hypothetical protein
MGNWWRGSYHAQNSSKTNIELRRKIKKILCTKKELAYIELRSKLRELPCRE